MTMTATIAGAISFLANFGFFFRGNGERANPLAMIAAMVLAPFAAMLVQLAISRTREYGADRAGAELSRNPRALASALAKLARSAARMPSEVAARNPAASALYIVPGRPGRDNLFSTHPDTANRIAELEAMALAIDGLGSRIDRGTPRASVSVPPTRRRSALDPFGRRG